MVGSREDESKMLKTSLEVLHIVTMNRKETSWDTMLEGRHFSLRKRTTGEKR